jgi:hypothetical protein
MRMLDIIKSDINSDKLKSEEELERVLNDKSLETDDKVATIKKLLREIAISEISFKKLEGYMSDAKDIETNEE